ncbi:MAG: hypothetical protein IPN01_28340 [Deltaproteobacteria bacterium]|nr:hypothetical protein [Deltaproteobacteria bacterium]
MHRALLPLLLLLACSDDATKDTTSGVDSGVGADSDGSDSAGSDSAGSDSDAVVDNDGDGVSAEEDCDDADATTYPGAAELCDGKDNSCDGAIDEGVQTSFYTDGDGDGYGAGEATLACEAPSGAAAQDGDCDDADPRYNPGAAEADCADPNDYNCDGSVGYADGDGDGFAACQECDDGAAAVNPDATEVCDGLDNNCDGSTDGADAQDAMTYYADTDGDGFGDLDFAVLDCAQPEGYVADKTDCDDGVNEINPAATETCDSLDNDCDGLIDGADDSVDLSTGSTFYADTDGDGFGDAGAPILACEAPKTGAATNDADCDDGDGAVNPDATEVCDEFDNDCDGLIDDDDDSVDLSTGDTFYTDTDGDGYGDSASTVTACALPSGAATVDGDCDDGAGGTYPGATDGCDGEDNNCDGLIDEDSTVGLQLVSVEMTSKTGTVYAIDAATASSKALASLSTSTTVGFNSATYDSASGRTIAHDYSNAKLWELDVCDGTMSEIGPTGVGNTCGIVFGPGGLLYGLDTSSDSLVTLDPATGAATSVGSLGISLGSCGLAYDCASDTLIGVDQAGAQLFYVDAATGAATTKLPLGISFGSVGVEYNPVDGMLYIMNGTNLYMTNPATGSSSLVGAVAFTGSKDDLSFVPECAP